MRKVIFMILDAVILNGCTTINKPSYPASEDFFVTWEFKGNNDQGGFSEATFTL